MSNTVPAQHPAVVLRSHYRNLRSLLAVALVAIVGLTATVVVLAGDDDPVTSTSSVSQPSVRLSDPYQGRTQPTVETGSATRSYPTLQDTFQSQAESPRPDSKPDESSVAAAISQQPQTAVSGPDEARIAATLGQHENK